MLGPVSKAHVLELLQAVNIFRLNVLHEYWLCDLYPTAVVCLYETVSESNGNMFPDEIDNDSENV